MNDIIAKPTQTMAILKEYDIRATKKFGQNFLIDPNIVNNIATLACDKDTITLEIGPGIGSLTQFLLKYSKFVYAHEIDKKLQNLLKDIFKDEENLEIIPGDFMKVSFKDMPYYDKEIVVCANLPYYITTPILFKLFESDLKIKRIVVMVQKEVAERFVAKVNTPDYNALTIITNHQYDIKYEFKVKKTVFYPSPNVDSAIISFTPKDIKEDNTLLYDFIQDSFRQRRKTLKNNLCAKYDNIEEVLKKLNYKDAVRPQELGIDDYIKIFGELNES